MDYNKVSEDDLRNIIKNAKNWKEVCDIFDITKIFVEIQRKIIRYNIDCSHIQESYIEYNIKIKNEYIGHISDEKIKEIIKNAKNWNDVLRDCELITMTRSLQRRLNKIPNSEYSHLPKNFGGLYSKLGKYSKEYYYELVINYKSWDEILKTLKYTSSFHIKIIKNHFDQYDINYSNLTYPEISNKKKIELKDILVENSMYSSRGLKQRLINELGWKRECYHCGKSTFSNKFVSNIPIPLELEHKSGIHSDNRIENLCFLCPTCHSLTPTYCSNNKSIEKLNAVKLLNKKQEEILAVNDKIEKINIETSEELQLLKKELNEITLKLKPLPVLKIIEPKVEKEVEPIIRQKTNKCIDCNLFILNTSTRCVECQKKFNLESNIKEKSRPSYEQLLQDMKELKTYIAIAPKYKVSDVTIKKWLKKYEELNKSTLEEQPIIEVVEEPQIKKCIDCNKNIKDDLMRCISCNKKFKPTYEQLQKDIKELKTFIKIGIKYNVNGDTVSRWIKKYKEDLE